MIGKYLDETKMSREDAYKFIANRCDSCEIADYCTDKYDCMEKVSYLIKKYTLDVPDPGTHMQFPETLKVLLQYRHLSICRFAKDSGLVETTIRGWLSGKNLPTMSQIYKICDFFQITPNFLLGYDGICEKIDVELSTKDLQEQLDAVINDLDILCNSVIYAQQKLNRIKCMGGTEN